MPDERAAERRHIGEAARGGIRLILADEAEFLRPAVVARDGHDLAEADGRHVRTLAGELRAGAPRSKVAEVARRRRDCRPVAALLRLGERGAALHECGIEQRQTAPGDEVLVRADRPVGQLVDEIRPVRLFHESSAHPSKLEQVRQVCHSRALPHRPFWTGAETTPIFSDAS